MLTFPSAYRSAGQNEATALCSSGYNSLDQNGNGCFGEPAFEPSFTPISEIRSFNVLNTSTGLDVQVYQRVRSSAVEVRLGPGYQEEIQLTAALILGNNVSVHLFMKEDLNVNPYQPSSSFNEHNQLFVSGEKDDTHTALLQYGSPDSDAHSDTLSDWYLDLTLSSLQRSKLGDSLQGIVLKEGGNMRVYDVGRLANSEYSSSIASSFFSAARDSILKCKDDVVEEMTCSNEGLVQNGKTDVLFLLDSSASMRNYTQALADGMTRFADQLKESGVSTRYAVATFGGAPTLLQKFSVYIFSSTLTIYLV
jgi:hypothetical protein